MILNMFQRICDYFSHRQAVKKFEQDTQALISAMRVQELNDAINKVKNGGLS